MDPIFKGDLVEFGRHGALYVVSDHSENRYWVTDDENQRYNSNARGWNILKSSAREVIERGKSNQVVGYLMSEDEEYEQERRFIPSYLRM